MPIVNGLVTLEDVRASLGLPAGTTQYDTDLQNYINAATPLIERETGAIYQRSATYTFDGGHPAVSTPERFSSIQSVTENGIAITDYYPVRGSIIYAGTTLAQRCFLWGAQNIVVTCTIGLSVVPPHVQLGAREMVRLWWQQGRQANRPGTAEVDTSQVPVGFAMPRAVGEKLAATPRLPGFA